MLCFIWHYVIYHHHMFYSRSDEQDLTLYLMGGGIERLPLDKIAPVHQGGVTFLIIFLMTIPIYTYIIRFFSFPDQK